MRSLTICIWCVMACVLQVLGQHDPPPVGIAKISLPDPAYIGMPIWMKINSRSRYKIHYPSSTTPNDFYCNEVQVKHGSRLLAPVVGLPAEGRAGAACGWLGVEDIAESRLPIHLQYPLTEPGTYMVRFIRHEYRPGQPGTAIAEQSDWVELHLRAAPPGMVEEWLRNQLTALPSSPGRLLGDALPSLLASGDPRVLRLMIQTSYHTDPTVAHFAANSLVFFEPEQVRTQLLVALRKRGPNDALGSLFGSRGNIVTPIAAEIVAACLPYLRSPAPASVEGAVHVLSVMRNPYFGLPTETTTRIAAALQADIDFIIAQKNEKAAWWIANLVGATRPSGGRLLLWKLVDAGLTVEQGLICVTWFHDPSDLPRLAATVKQGNPSDPHGYQLSGVVTQMQAQYGPLARLYLRDILASSGQTSVRTAAAQGLVQMNDRAGWEFVLDTVRQRPSYRGEMIRWLEDLFPALRNADDSAITTFLESMVTAATDHE